MLHDCLQRTSATLRVIILRLFCETIEATGFCIILDLLIELLRFIFIEPCAKLGKLLLREAGHFGFDFLQSCH